MKTILRIITILLVASVVAGAFSLTLNNSSSASSTSQVGPSAVTDASGQSVQPMERPEGSSDGGSIAGGLAGVLGTLVKLTGISILVLLLQKGFSQLRSRSLAFNQR